MLKRLFPRLRTAFQALVELGPQPLLLFGWYQLAQRSGWSRRRIARALQQAQAHPSSCYRLNWEALPPLPSRAALRALGEDREALAGAEEMLGGHVRLFGGSLSPLRWDAPSMESDIKFTWEPGRFGWALQWARAYHRAGDERYAAAFWEQVEAFWQANPAGKGPHWESGQEVALRLIAWAFCIHVFRASEQTTSERLARMAVSIAAHAARIPPTLIYARSQQNNHLLTEAAGLYTAGLLLPQHPQAQGWRKLGWRWLNRGVQEQVDSGGGYIQHSTNYHRLMLQTLTWVAALDGDSFPRETTRKLALAVDWLLQLVDPLSGNVPNLGPNDGAYILPLSNGPFEDYRPALAAAGQHFLGQQPFGAGPWQEMLLWLPTRGFSSIKPEPSAHSPLILRPAGGTSWAYLRTVHFTSRPGHADLLHLDLWTHGMNLALDPGTYRYNGAFPWENALTSAAFHNTVTVEGQDQMRRAGRFLYLGWADADFLCGQRSGPRTWEACTARHRGYRRLGVEHQRTVRCLSSQVWQVEDRLQPLVALGEQRARLQWLLPDFPFQVQPKGEGWTLMLQAPFGCVRLEFSLIAARPLGGGLTLVRAGERLSGEGEVLPQQGWFSPTYGVLRPALSCVLEAIGTSPFGFDTQWSLPE